MAGAEAESGFRMDDDTVVLDDDLARPLGPGEPHVGWLARRGYVPLGYLGDEAKTRRTYPRVGGLTYSIPGDRARVAADGRILVLGRDSVCINSGGEKIFAEEVERALKRHPSVYDAVVVGTPDERWGQKVTALVAPRPWTSPGEEEIREAAAVEVARYKLPRAFVFVDEVRRAPTGKPDYRWAMDTALSALARSACRGSPEGSA